MMTTFSTVGLDMDFGELRLSGRRSARKAKTFPQKSMKTAVLPPALQAQRLVEVGGNLGHESAGLHHHGGATLGIHLGITEIELIPRPGDRDIEQAPLLFHVPGLDRAAERKEALGHADE